MINNPLMKERIKLFKDTVKAKNNKRVLNIGNVWAWSVCDHGYPLNTIARDYDMRLKSISEFQERYNFDFYTDFWSCNPVLITDELGGSACQLIDEPFNVITDDYNYMEVPDDYDLAINNYKEFVWSKIIPRKYPKLLEGNAIEMLKKAAVELDAYFKYNNDVYELMKEKYGTMSFFAGNAEFLTFYLQNLFTDYRGMQGLSKDIRRYHDKVLEACNYFGVLGIDTASKTVGSDPEKPSDYTWRGLAQTFLSRKQFEEFVYPQLKQLFDYAEKYDKIIFCFWQGENSRFYDYLKEAPEGHFVYYFEKDDLFKAKKFFGNKVALGGGMPSLMLNNGTSQECVDYAKKLIDELAYDGNYFFGADVMLSYPNDCKRENLLAVNEFVSNYRY